MHNYYYYQLQLILCIFYYFLFIFQLINDLFNEVIHSDSVLATKSQAGRQVGRTWVPHT